MCLHNFLPMPYISHVLPRHPRSCNRLFPFQSTDFLLVHLCRERLCSWILKCNKIIHFVENAKCSTSNASVHKLQVLKISDISEIISALYNLCEINTKCLLLSTEFFLNPMIHISIISQFHGSCGVAQFCCILACPACCKDLQ